MFVYQNKDGHICVTFTDNKPVEAPEFVFAIDEEAKAIYSVVGTVEKMPENEETEADVVVDAKVPTIEVLDSVEENDDVALDIAPVTAATIDDTTSERYHETEEANLLEDSKKAPMTEADNFGAPSVEELDAIVENDPEVVEEEEEENEDEGEESPVEPNEEV